MKNKAFTLIELLAVIVILAIIALIAVPIILNIIEDTKDSANKRSIDMYGDSITNAVADYMLSSNGIIPGWDDIKDNIDKYYEGNKVECDITQINSDGAVYLSECKVNGTKVDYTYGNGPTEYCTVTKGIGLRFGDEINCAGEEFYVIENDGTNIKMLAKYNLNVGDNPYPEGKIGIQNKNANGNAPFVFNNNLELENIDLEKPVYGAVQFSDTDYWGAGVPNKYVYDSNSNIYKYINEYNAYLKKNGINATEMRLLYINDINDLNESEVLTLIFDVMVADGFWFGNYFGNFSTGEGTGLDIILFDYLVLLQNLDLNNMSQEELATLLSIYSKGFGVRPYVEISMSNVDIKVSTLINGAEFNSKLATLVGDDATSILRESITSIEFLQNGILPAGYTLDSLQALESVSVSNDNSINAYYDGAGKIFVYSKNNISLNENSASLFAFNQGLTEILFNDIDTSKVTDMSGMFAGCTNLKSIDLSKFDTSKVTNMLWMFRGAGLESINLNSFNTSNVTNMSGMFAELKNIEGISFGLFFNTSNVTNMGSMFEGSTNLKSLNLDEFDTSNVTNMAFMFSGCNNLEYISFSYLFNTSKVDNMEYMFADCWKLDNLNLFMFDTGNVADMKWMFYNCKSLGTLNLGNFDTRNVTNMSEMFSGCINLGSLNLSNWNTSLVYDMDSMFFHCSKLTELDLTSFTTNELTDIENMFSSCTSLTSILVSDSNWKVYTDSRSFVNCGTDYVTRV